MSQEFEMLCQDALSEVFSDETFVDIGRWWYNEYEVDVVGLTDNGTMVVGEYKFTSASLDYGVFASLEEHADKIRLLSDRAR